ncbi:hypothetical protein B0H13DRAFT_1630847 [Mycena leptocephala]|nr:hypothetical protein B0H13DRAFT_1630847 [Mycena leptocephala]
MPSDPESESLSSFSVVTKGRRPPRAHPRLTVYRILFFSLTAGFGTIKAIYSYQGQTMAPTTFDWVYSIVVVSALFWLGLYDEECPDKMPRWMFETDVVDSVVKMVNQLRGQYDDRRLHG